MYDSIPDLLRKRSIDTLFEATTFSSCWNTWQGEIRRRLPPNYNETNLLDLGDCLSDIFRTTGATGRGQGSLSGGGAAWESLVCWFINLCTAGSRVVAVKRMGLVPSAVQDAITVNYGNVSCNTESDITVIVFPNTPDFLQNAMQLLVYDQNGNIIPTTTASGKFNDQIINELVVQQFPNLEIGIIQCKTNWNDNAQIPMLWDMIYSAGGFRRGNITIGRNNFGIQNIRFSYSFVTVPSNNTQYNSSSVAVKRVTNLTGGNYWGQSTISGVAKSLKEIFGNNWSSGSNINLRADLHSALPHFSVGQPLEYFRL